MLIRNFKSSADEIAKRQLADELLKVEISNASILDERIGKALDKNAPPPVPPQYKSVSDILKDEIELDKRIIDGLMEAFNFSYSEASQVLTNLTGEEEKRQLVVGIPAIKHDIEVRKHFNPKLITPEFLNNYLIEYFEDMAVSHGFAFGKETTPDLSGITSLSQIIPQKASVERLYTIMDGLADRIEDVSGKTQDKYGELMTVLEELAKLLLPPVEENRINDLGSQRERQQMIKAFNRVSRELHLPSNQEFIQYGTTVQGDNDRGLLQGLRLNSHIDQLHKRLSFLTRNNLKKLRLVITDLIEKTGGVPEPDLEEMEINPIPEGSEEAIHLIQGKEKKLRDALEYVKNQITNEDRFGTYVNTYALAKDIMEKLSLATGSEITQLIDNNGRAISKRTIDNVVAGITKIKSAPTASKIKEGIMNLITPIIQGRIDNPNPPYYVPQTHSLYSNRDLQVGFGMTKSQKALKEHFKEDEKFLKKVAKKVSKREETDSESSSDEETIKMLKKHAKAEKPAETKIEKVLGEGYVHRRIPVKKIIGKGVEVEEQPSYRVFGKYVINIPYLHHKNQLKIKYPSLGSIPSIPPITVSEDYKDFINDVLDNGKANQRAFDKLPHHEQAHFEKVCRGAGLLEIFKLKRNGDDDEKHEVDRFNLLRGNYLGGNNSKDVINELKSLTVKFINGGKITRREGLDMLMELSII